MLPALPPPRVFVVELLLLLCTYIRKHSVGYYAKVVLYNARTYRGGV